MASILIVKGDKTVLRNTLEDNLRLLNYVLLTLGKEIIDHVE